MSRKRPFWRHPKWTKAHRWITLAIGLQLIFWITSGAVFVFSDIDNVHGDFEFEKPKAAGVSPELLGPDAVKAVRVLGKSLGREVLPTAITLLRRLDRDVIAVYENGSRTPSGYVDAQTRELAAPVSAEQAGGVALAHYKGKAEIRSVAWLEEAPLEYRGKPLPVYRVDFADRKETSFYISPKSGQVVTRRNWNWRLFDWFWMLHTMDYWERDDFNHWLIRLAAVAAAFAAISGIVLLFQRFIKQGH